MRRLLTIAILSTTAIALTGCGDSPDVKLEKARQHLKIRQPDQAVNLAQQVLQADPENADAQRILAEAHLRGGQFDAARKAIDRLIEKSPDDVEIRKLLDAWVFVKLDATLRQSDFSTNKDVQGAYNKTLDEGSKLADWYEVQGKMPAQGAYLRGRLAQHDSVRNQLLLRERKNQLNATSVGLPEAGDDDPDKIKDPEAQSLQNRIDTARSDAEGHFKKALEANPDLHDAAERYAQLVALRAGWAELWVLGQKAAERKDQPAELVEKMVLHMLSVPSEEQPIEKRREVGWKLLGTLAEDQKETPTAKLTEARLHLASQEIEKARPLLEAVLSSKPQDINGRYLLAQVYFDEKDYEKAKDILDKLATDNLAKRAAEVHNLRGLVYEELGDYTQAKTSWSEAEDLNPNSPAVAHRARLLAEEGQTGAVQSEVWKLYVTDPADPSRIQTVIQFAISEDNNETIEKVLERTELLGNKMTLQHILILADGYKHLQKLSKAERYARELVKQRPDEIGSHIKLAEVMLLQNRDQDVAKLVQELKEKFEDSPSVEAMLGRLYLQKQDNTKALELLEKSVEADPENIDSRIFLAHALASLAMTEQALEQIDQILDRDPTESRAHSLAARIYQFTGQSAKAEQHLSKIQEDKISAATSPALLAQIRLRQGKLEEALKICNAAIASGAGDPILRLMLANIYIRKGEPEKAEPHLIALIRKQPDNPQAYQLLARYYLQHKKVQPGMVKFAELQKLNEPLGRLAKAMLLSGSKRYNEALEELVPLYNERVEKDDRNVPTLADSIAQTYLAVGARERAYQTYQPMIKAGHFEGIGRLRQIDLMWAQDDDETRYKKINELAAILKHDDLALRREVLRRLTRIRKTDRAAELLDQWITQEPKEAIYVRWKGEQQIELGRTDDAIQSLEKAITLEPENKRLYQQLAAANILNFNFPAAEKVYGRLAKLDAAAEIVALSSLGQMYTDLGLNEQAVKTFDALKDKGQSHDPRNIYAMGRAYAALSLDDRAMNSLKRVPSYAPQYAAAQVLLAQLEQRNAKVEDAQKRLETLASSAQHTLPATVQLLKLNWRVPSAEQLLNWADRMVIIERLPDRQKIAWLGMRTTLAANRKDWREAQEALEQIQKVAPKSLNTMVSRIAIMWSQNQVEQAREILLSSPDLQKSPVGPTLGAMLGFKVPSATYRKGLPAYFEALVKGDIDAAIVAVDTVPPMRAVFRSDLKAMLQRPDIKKPEMVNASQSLLAALLARQAGLPQLTAHLANGVAERMPSLIPAHAILVESLLDMSDTAERDKAHDRVRKFGGSALVIYLDAVAAARSRDHAASISATRELLKQEPENWFAQYHLAQQLQLAKQYNEAIEALRVVSRGNGPFRLAAVNDLAYTLAEHKKDELDQAYAMASRAYEVSPTNLPLLDTIGWIEHLRGNNAKAKEHLTRSITGLGSLPEVHYHLGVVYKELKQNVWAKYHLTQAASGPADRPETGQAKQLLEQLSAGE